MVKILEVTDQILSPLLSGVFVMLLGSWFFVV